MISPGKLLPYALALGLSSIVFAANSVMPAVQAQETIGETIAADKAKLDLNTASPAELKSLGLGDNYIRRIVEGRPYTAKNQLVTRGILPASAYEPIKERIIAHRPTQR